MKTEKTSQFIPKQYKSIQCSKTFKDGTKIVKSHYKPDILYDTVANAFLPILTILYNFVLHTKLRFL